MEQKENHKGKIRVLLALLVLLTLLGGLVALVSPREEGPDRPAEPEATLPEPPANPYAETDFYREGEFILCDGGEFPVGVDVSSHQNEIDWQAVAESGVDFAMIRVGYRGYTEGGLFTDEYWEENVAGALDAGLQVGVYFYSQAISVEEAKEEAKFVLKALRGWDITFPVVFDWECVGEQARTWGASSRLVTDCTAAFCDAVERAGYIPAFYFNQSMAMDTFRLRELQSYDFWLAQYHDAMTFPYAVQLWQYTCTGTVPGITGDVDLNLSFRDYGEKP